MAAGTSNLARVYGAVMRSRLLAVTFDARDPPRLAQFWAGMLGREVVEDAGGALLPGKFGRWCR